jgi:hypothetical protein
VVDEPCEFDERGVSFGLAFEKILEIIKKESKTKIKKERQGRTYEIDHLRLPNVMDLFIGTRAYECSNDGPY